MSKSVVAADNENWEEFAKAHLLGQGIFNGLALLSLHGVSIYTYGVMDTADQGGWLQFSKLFQHSCGHQEQDLLNQGFKLNFDGGREVKYTIYNKSFSSAYCTSAGGEEGLIVCKLPYGILVCNYSNKGNSTAAVKLVEDFCDMLRA